LEYFKSNFEYSPFCTKIDNADVSIKSNLTSIHVKRKTILNLNKETSYTFRMLNTIEKGSVMSSYFDYNEPNKISNDRYYIKDDSNGNVMLVKLSPDSKQLIIKSKIGEVDYDKGIIHLTSFMPVDYIGSNIFSIYATPSIKERNGYDRSLTVRKATPLAPFEAGRCVRGLHHGQRPRHPLFGKRRRTRRPRLRL
jgi:hypothetical protein